MMTVTGIIYCVGWLSESLIHYYLVEDLHKPYSAEHVCVCMYLYGRQKG